MKNLKILYFFFIIIFLSTCTQQENINYSTIQNEILSNPQSFFYINVKEYPSERNHLPIGIFDSGTGGLTVLDAIVNADQFNNLDHSASIEGDKKRDFDEEYFIYLGDKANMPYGEYAGNNKTDLLKEHIMKDMQFLLGKKYYRSGHSETAQTDKSEIKALVIACNTATAYGKNDIEAFIDSAGLDMKVIGVIGAGVRGALETIEKKEDAVIGIMATDGTVASNGYPNTVIDQKNRVGYSGKIESFQQAGIGLAAAIDGEKDYLDPQLTFTRPNYRGPSFNNEKAKVDKNILNRYDFDFTNNQILFSGEKNDPNDLQINSIRNYIAYHVISLLETIKKSGTKNKLKSVILGCTHYPFFKEEFQREFNRAYNLKENGNFIYRKYMIKNIKLVDPAVNTAKELYTYLNKTNLFNNGNILDSEFYISVPNYLNNNNIIDEDGNFTYEYKYGREARNTQEYVKRVPFSYSSLPKDVIERLPQQIPFTFELIKSFNYNNPKTAFLTEKDKI